jgi:hypothetical protein
VQYLRGQAKGTVKEYVTEQCAIDTILKHAFEILQTTDDNREKLQSMKLFKDTHLVKLDLLSIVTTIDSALSYIRSKQQSQQKKNLSLDSTSSDDGNDRNIGNGLQSATGIQSVF